MSGRFGGRGGGEHSKVPHRGHTGAQPTFPPPSRNADRHGEIPALRRAPSHGNGGGQGPSLFGGQGWGGVSGSAVPAAGL